MPGLKKSLRPRAARLAEALDGRGHRPEILRERDLKKLIPPLHGARSKNEQGRAPVRAAGVHGAARGALTGRDCPRRRLIGRGRTGALAPLAPLPPLSFRHFGHIWRSYLLHDAQEPKVTFRRGRRGWLGGSSSSSHRGDGRCHLRPDERRDDRLRNGLNHRRDHRFDDRLDHGFDNRRRPSGTTGGGAAARPLAGASALQSRSLLAAARRRRASRVRASTPAISSRVARDQPDTCCAVRPNAPPAHTKANGENICQARSPSTMARASISPPMAAAARPWRPKPPNSQRPGVISPICGMPCTVPGNADPGLLRRDAAERRIGAPIRRMSASASRCGLPRDQARPTTSGGHRRPYGDDRRPGCRSRARCGSPQCSLSPCGA